MISGIIIFAKFCKVNKIPVKDWCFFKAFGDIEKKMREQGFTVFTADIDSFGCIETNAVQLKEYVNKILKETNSEKVNLICHSKGGLDSKYMITDLEMEDKIASMTTLSTPFKGSIVASKVWELPGFIKAFLAFWVNLFYRILGDKHPDALKTLEQLKRVDTSIETLKFSNKIYCQSYSSTMNDGSDFLMLIPSIIHKRFEAKNNDGLVTGESSKFGEYNGDCFDISVSHSKMIDFMSTKSQKDKIYAFYIKLAEDLMELGF